MTLDSIRNSCDVLDALASLDANDTSNTSNTANSSDAIKTSASVTRLSSFLLYF